MVQIRSSALLERALCLSEAFHRNSFLDQVLAHYLLSQKVFIKSFCKKPIPAQTWPFLFFTTNAKNTLTYLCGN